MQELVARPPDAPPPNCKYSCRSAPVAFEVIEPTKTGAGMLLVIGKIDHSIAELVLVVSIVIAPLDDLPSIVIVGVKLEAT